MSDENTGITFTIEGNRVSLQVAGDAKVSNDHLPLSDDTLDIKVLDLCRRLIENNQIKSRADFQVIGRLLHKALFTPAVQGEFNSTWKLLKPRSDKRVCVELKFLGNDTQGLFKLPWEYLCYKEDTGDWEFVSTVTKMVLTRNLPSKAAGPKLVDLDDKKLNVLMVVLNPDPNGLGDLSRVETDVAGQLDKFKENLRRHNIEVVVRSLDKPVTWKHFEEAINESTCQPHILHLIAHGQFREDRLGRSGQIAFHLVDQPHDIDVGIEGGNINWKSDRDFVNLFAAANKLPRFAFLHMCEGGAIDKEDASVGVALRLAQEGVPAVVAMQHPIDIETSTFFSETVYENLAAGYTIDEAVQTGRARIEAKDANNKAFGTPVLYLSTRSDSILPKIPKPSKELQAKSSLIITSLLFNQHLWPCFKGFRDRDSDKLTAEQMDPLLKALKALVGCPSDKWLLELEGTYRKYDLFDHTEEMLADLCTQLVKKVQELMKGQHGD